MTKSWIYYLLIIAMSSCKANEIIETPVNSKRGDAVFSLIVPDNNYGKLEDIHIYCWTQNGELNANRVLLDFNLNNIPSNAKIKSAFLDLHFNSTSAYNKVLGNKGHQGKENIVIQRVTSDWNENYVTWNKQPQSTAMHQVVISKTKNPRADYKGINVTQLVKDMLNNKSDNFGFLIRYEKEEPYNVDFFASSNHTNIDLHPKLTVVYK
jgi:hypothetical protein